MARVCRPRRRGPFPVPETLEASRPPGRLAIRASGRLGHSGKVGGMDSIRLDRPTSPTGVASYATHEGSRREAARLAPREHARGARAAVAVAWRAVTRSLRDGGG